MQNKVELLLLMNLETLVLLMQLGMAFALFCSSATLLAWDKLQFQDPSHVFHCEAHPAPHPGPVCLVWGWGQDYSQSI